MPELGVEDQARYGLHLVPSHDAAFRDLVDQIDPGPGLFGRWEDQELESAAVLLNGTGKAIVVLAHTWQYTTASGRTRNSNFTNLVSSTQMDILAGESPVPDALGTCILPGSKRLITEMACYGCNGDVLPEEQWNLHRGGIQGAARPQPRPEAEETVRKTLSLDLAILEDGLCIGPDRQGRFSALVDSMEAQRSAAKEVVAAIESGASDGALFEILAPLARQSRVADRRSRHAMMTPMFARMAVNRLLDDDRQAMLAWFQRKAAPSYMKLRRAS